MISTKNVLIEVEILSVEDVIIKKDIRRISAAILKNAYLILFSKTGYTFLFDPYYNCLR